MSTVFRRRYPAAAAGATLVLLVTLAGGPAHADRGGPTAHRAGDPDLIAMQDPDGRQLRLTDLKTWILDRPGLASSGYIESVNDAATLTTTLLWHGPADRVQRAIIAEGAKRGIDVRVRQRKFSRAQLVREAESLAVRGKDAIAGYDINSVSGITEFDGLTVMATPDAATTATARATAVAPAAVAELDREVTAETGLDIRVTIGGGGDEALAVITRGTDTPPFNAGGMMYSPSSRGYCTTGFAVYVNGNRHTTTARHCMQHDYRPLHSSVYNYGDGVRNSGDGAAREMSASGSHLMFDGAYNNTVGYKKSVVGYGDVSIGDSVCTSGANSGVHCGIKITDLVHMWSDQYPHVSNPYFSTIVGQQVNGTTAACKGDSGGPVLIPVDSARVKAVGMIQGGPVNDSNYWSSSPTWSSSSVCVSKFWFSAMRTIVNTLPNASLATG